MEGTDLQVQKNNARIIPEGKKPKEHLLRIGRFTMKKLLASWSWPDLLPGRGTLISPSYCDRYLRRAHLGKGRTTRSWREALWFRFIKEMAPRRQLPPWPSPCTHTQCRTFCVAVGCINSEALRLRKHAESPPRTSFFSFDVMPTKVLIYQTLVCMCVQVYWGGGRVKVSPYLVYPQNVAHLPLAVSSYITL